MFQPNLLFALSTVTTALLTSGCPLVEVEVEAPSICVNTDSIEFDGAPDIEMTGDAASLETSVDVSDRVRSIRDALTSAKLTGTFVLRSARARLEPDTSEQASFQFVEGLRIVAHAPSFDPASAIVLECDDCSTMEGLLDLGIDPVDMSSYVNSGELVLDLAVLGQPPQESWSMSIELCFASTASYERTL